MERKELFYIGNLFGDNTIYGVRAVKPFDSCEIHGPFKSENTANNYAHDLAKSDLTYDRIEVIVIDLKLSPDSKQIVRDESGRDGPYKYAV